VDEQDTEPSPDIESLNAENRELRESKARLTADLERLTREFDAFTYAVSHDLRAPLRAIDGFSEMLVEDCAAQLDADGNHYVTRIRAGARRMAMLLDGLLHLSRIGRTAFMVERVNLSQLATQIVAELRTAHPDRTVSVEIEDGLHATGDRRFLQMALSHLLDNSWKFTSRTTNACIEFGRHVNHEPAFFVRDNGAGFDMTYASRLFTPFQRLHGTDEFEGIGIGLAAAQRIIQRHGGRIWPEAASDRGATLFFTLPGS
jgi:light-regulated signal transduction histidine kinase (bacteriophytochrome)